MTTPSFALTLSLDLLEGDPGSWLVVSFTDAGAVDVIEGPLPDYAAAVVSEKEWEANGVRAEIVESGSERADEIAQSLRRTAEPVVVESDLPWDLDELRAAVDRVAGLDPEVWGEVAPRFTGSEVAAVAGLFDALGLGDAAEFLRTEATD